MQRASQKERYEFIAILAMHLKPETMTDGKVHCPSNEVERFAKRLMRYGATLGRIAENQCNGYQDWRGNWDQQAADREEKKEERIRAKVTALCAEFGCTPIFSGDPRGNTLKIRVPDGYTNDWGREGICVPTS